MHELSEVENEVKETGTLEDSRRQRIRAVWGGLDGGMTFTPFPSLHAVADEAWEAISSDPAERKRTLMAAIEADRARLSIISGSATQFSEDRAADAAMVASVPPAEALDKLVRYEAHLERLLARALDQLYGSQRARTARDNVVELDARKGSA